MLEESHKAEMTRLMADHEAELEKNAGGVLEAKQFAQEVQRKHQLAERDYEAAKKSASLHAEHTKAMEEEQESWIKFLQELDDQISSEFLLRPLSEPDLFSLILIVPSFGYRAGAWPGLDDQASEAVKKIRDFRATEAAKNHEGMDPQ